VVTAHRTVEKRLTVCRLAVWLAALAVAWGLFRVEYPSAWCAAAFGALFTLLWPLARRARPAPSSVESPGAEEAAAEPETPGETGPEAPDPLASAIEVGVDLIAITALVNLTGGFNSPFSPLYFLVVVEADARLGSASALSTALAAAVLSLLHLRVGPVSREAAVLYGMAMGSLLLTALLVGLRQGAERFAGGERSPFRFGQRATLMKPRTVETLEQQLEAQAEELRQMKARYREVAHLHREQKMQIDRLRAAEQLFEASAAVPTGGDAREAYGRLLHTVMDRLDAGGAALWLRERGSDRLSVQATEGRVAPTLRQEAISGVADLPPGDLRALCEAHLLAAAPVTASAIVHRPPSADGDAEPEAAPTEMAGVAKPVLAVLLREAAAGEVGAILGAVGVCDPRGAARFSPTDAERLSALAGPLAAALSNVEQRRDLQRRVRETSLLYDLSRLVQSATDRNQLYNAIVTLVLQVVPYENCTLFLLDRENARLEAKATRGRVVNLLDHVAFEKGQGVSGWVASRGRQLILSDLTQEQNLLNVETIPPRVRSFAAIPLQVQDTIVGVLNVSHSQPHAFAPEDLQLLTVLAGQAAITIERTEAFHTLEALAITDGLTQVYNHRYFQMRLEDELKRGRRYGQPVSLMIVDADDFKRINDQYGHVTGDFILRELAGLLRRSVRETEIAARYGGEEFALILPHTGVEQARVAAERVRAIVETHTFLTPEGHSIRLTISIGAATYPAHARTRAELIAQADAALYAAKQTGRNAVRLAADTGAFAVTGSPRGESPAVPSLADLGPVHGETSEHKPTAS